MAKSNQNNKILISMSEAKTVKEGKSRTIMIRSVFSLRGLNQKFRNLPLSIKGPSLFHGTELLRTLLREKKLHNRAIKHPNIQTLKAGSWDNF